MSDIAVRVENLSKQYRIGGKQAGYRTFRETLLDSFAAPVRWMRGERKAYEIFWALDDVSFDIKQGEAVGIIGRNGAGKSTLLKILSRITKPTKGRVDLYGRVASLLEVGTGFHGELSGRDNIYLNGAILGMSRREIARKFDEIVDFAEVDKFLDTQVKHYSSGMYVRLAFAVAAHLEPEILIVDEVLAVGDLEFQKKSLGKMNDVSRQQGVTVILVSHNMGMINSLCTRAVLLHNGALLASGETASITAQYSNNGKSSPYSVDYSESERRVGDHFATLISANIEDETGRKTGEIRIDQGFIVRMKYRLHDATPNSSYPNFHFYNSQGQCVFISAGERASHISGDAVYEAVCHIPGRLLNSDIYFIGVALTFTHNGIHVSFFEPDALSVVMIEPLLDETFESGREGYGGPIPGIIRPKLNWEIRIIP